MQMKQVYKVIYLLKIFCYFRETEFVKGKTCKRKQEVNLINETDTKQEEIMALSKLHNILPGPKGNRK